MSEHLPTSWYDSDVLDRTLCDEILVHVVLMYDVGLRRKLCDVV